MAIVTQTQWRRSMEAAQHDARTQGKLVLVDLFSPG